MLRLTTSCVYFFIILPLAVGCFLFFVNGWTQGQAVFASLLTWLVGFALFRLFSLLEDIRFFVEKLTETKSDPDNNQD